MSEAERHATPYYDIIAYPLHGNCYLNTTARCTLRCNFCPKYNRTWEVQSYDLRLHHEPDVQEVLAAVGDPTRFKEIVFCGLGEPTLRLELLLAVARALKAQGATIRVNTDGLANLVHGRDVTPELEGVVDALSISMNAQDEETYIRHCRPRKAGAFAAMLAFAGLAKRYVPSVTLTAIDGLEGVDVARCAAMAEAIGVHFRRRVLDAVG